MRYHKKAAGIFPKTLLLAIFKIHIPKKSAQKLCLLKQAEPVIVLPFYSLSSHSTNGVLKEFYLTLNFYRLLKSYKNQDIWII
jgi:hypothetical protein